MLLMLFVKVTLVLLKHNTGLKINKVKGDFDNKKDTFLLKNICRKVKVKVSFLLASTG